MALLRKFSLGRNVPNVLFALVRNHWVYRPPPDLKGKGIWEELEYELDEEKLTSSEKLDTSKCFKFEKQHTYEIGDPIKITKPYWDDVEDPQWPITIDTPELYLRYNFKDVEMVEEAIEELRKFRERYPWRINFLTYYNFPQPRVYLYNNRVRLYTRWEYRKLLKSLPEEERRKLEKENEEDIYLPPSYIEEIGKEAYEKNKWLYKYLSFMSGIRKRNYDLTPTGVDGKRRLR